MVPGFLLETDLETNTDYMHHMLINVVPNICVSNGKIRSQVFHRRTESTMQICYNTNLL